MRIVSYNIAFGFDARSLLKNAIGHFNIHVLRNSWITSKSMNSVKDAFEFAAGFNPDIVCINEVVPDIFGEQGREILRQAGFKKIAEGREEHHPYPLAIASWAASKDENSEEIKVNLPGRDKTGGGGGNCALYIPSLNTTFFAVHLGLHHKKRMRQCQALSEYIKAEQDKGRRIILAGDFNASLEEIKKGISAGNMGLNGCSLPTNTYARMPFSLISSASDLDHVIWSKEFNLQNATEHRGKSDHSLVCCDLTASEKKNI